MKQTIYVKGIITLGMLVMTLLPVQTVLVSGESVWIDASGVEFEEVEGGE